MRSIFKKIISLICVSLIAVPTTRVVGSIATSVGKSEFLYLAVGLDDAAQNTDAILLVSYDSMANSAAVVQLPRDTYCEYGSGFNKVNGLYAHYRSSGLSSEQAMDRLTNFLGEQLGVTFDGYFAITTEAFRNAIDAVGGVKVRLGEEFVYNGKGENDSFTLNVGENVLDGRKSEIFVRYRYGYALGDLSRMDAQKVFLDGLYESVVKNVGYDDVVRAYNVARKGIVTDFSLVDVFLMLARHSSKFRDTDIVYLTMPGKAASDDSGIWYYILNRKATIGVIERYLFSGGAVFDKKRLFTNEAKKYFDSIYDSDSISWKEYRAGEPSDIVIPKKEQ